GEAMLLPQGSLAVPQRVRKLSLQVSFGALSHFVDFAADRSTSRCSVFTFTSPRRRPTMQYLLLIYSNEQSHAQMPDAELGAMSAEYMTFTENIAKSGHYKGGN